MFCVGNITWPLLAWDIGFLDSFSLTLVVLSLNSLQQKLETIQSMWKYLHFQQTINFGDDTYIYFY